MLCPAITSSSNACCTCVAWHLSLRHCAKACSWAVSHCLVWYAWIPVRIGKKKLYFGLLECMIIFSICCPTNLYKDLCYLGLLASFACYVFHSNTVLLNPFPSSATEQSSLGSLKRPNPNEELGPMSLYSQWKTSQLPFKNLWVVTQSHHLNLPHFQERVSAALFFLVRDKLLGNWT